MSQNTTLDVNAITKLVDDFLSTKIIPTDEHIAELKAQTNTAVYELVLDVRKLVRKIVKADEATMKSFLALRGGLKPARDGANGYLPIVRSIFARKIEGKWVLDRSRDKYANVLRYLDDQDVKDSDVVALLTKETLTKLEKNDREAHKSDTQSDRVEKARERGRTATSILTTHLPPTLAAKPDDVVVMWGVVRNGGLEIRAAEVADEDRANSLLYKLGNTIKSK